ncbi:MAG TPA: peptidase S41, partial [Cryomorphaceae bacterium]|nr:peptidase S41 [Cryomorphaceae bacterium]
MTYCQIEKPLTPLNLNFEIVEKGSPVGWESFGSSGYVLALDSSHAQNRQYSAYIGSTAESENFKAWAYTLPDNYDGKEITLSGYIKTEDVTEGYAGLWMRIDPSVAFDNMNGKGVTGTTDWTQYAITLTMDPEKTQKIVFGGLLVGKGKMWLDNLNITVDGKDLKDLKPLQRKIFPAEKDREFDEGSKITITSVDESQVKNLKTLGLIWGFLKYYHPNIASGQYNWDYELFRVLPRVLKAGSQASRDDILVKWIEDLGTFPRGKETDLTAEDVKLKPDLEWIENSGFSDELTAQL